MAAHFTGKCNEVTRYCNFSSYIEEFEEFIFYNIKDACLKILEKIIFVETGRYGHFANQYHHKVKKNCKFVSHLQAIRETIFIFYLLF